MLPARKIQVALVLMMDEDDPLQALEAALPRAAA
jgi:hypothetical protein